MRARIGITCSATVQEDRDVAAIDSAYVSAVANAGGLPFILPILDATLASETIASLDGLVLAGGGDIDPALYGQAAAPEVSGVDRQRDLYELALVQAASEAGLPTFGICRGLQMINVALGGTLVQHVPDLTGNNHRIDEKAREVVHAVSVVPRGTLARLLGTTSIRVNSLHHQAVDVLGHGLEIAARAEDGAVESVTATAADGARFVGVQWHPELLPNAVSDRLFGWLVTEASKPVVTQLPVTSPRSGRRTAAETAGKKARKVAAAVA